MASVPSVPDNLLQAVYDILADTGAGLTGSEIGMLLSRCAIDDPMPGMTKRHRLFVALKARQERDGCANNILAFVQQAMDPVRYTQARLAFDERRAALNQILIFAGLEVGQDGRLRQTTQARTLPEAEARAGRLRAELERRRVHPDVLRFCRAELLAENYFHAVLEASKSVASKIREKAGLSTDGAGLVDEAFGLGGTGVPLLAINTLRTDSERSEHTGLMNLLKGLFGAFRNPTAHAPKIEWPMNEQEALDLLTLVSLLHRRLDQVVRARR